VSPEIFFQIIVNGLFTGGIYALTAVGLTLIYGVLAIVNFAHGEFLMLGIYTALFLLGALIQRGLVQRVLDAHPLNQIVLLVGLSTLLIGLVQFFFSYETAVITLWGLRLSIARLVAFFASLLISLLLYMFLQFTRTGKAIRAVSQSRDAARLMGVNVNFVYALTFGIGTAITAVAGVLLAPNHRLIPTMGQAYSVIAFVVVVLGTMGNFIGAFLGGLIIGVVEAFAGFYLGGDVKIIASMMIFILILLFKPAGLFGRQNA